ncbi:MAG: FtsX-like permease family protein [Luteitalea sp.]|nr:FtsX-like permease family protein [Luteitalea sp.]
MILRDLFLRIRALVAPHRVERELDEELAFHIERETQKHVTAGLSPVDARTRALARFGPVPLAADRCRDARGTGFVDGLVRDILYAFRTFRRAPLAALTIVATVALGLGLVAVVFTVYSMFFLRVDAVRSPGELFAVELERWAGADADEDGPFTRPDYDAMRRETSVFTDALAMLPMNVTRIGGRPTVATLVTGNFFHVLGVQAALGRPLLPEDDEPGAGRPVIVLSDAGWRKLFRGDRAVIGRRMVVNGAPYEIVGVMPDGFRGLGVTPPDYWAPLALAEQFRDDAAGRADEIAVEVIGRLKPGLSPEAAAAALSVWASGRAEFKTPVGRPIQVSLTPRQGTLSSDGFALVFSPLFFAFGLILTIGCANVANLLLARGVSRQREIGIRLSLGASRRRLIRQLLTESLLLSLVAAACGLVIARLFLEGVLYATITTLPPEMAQFVNLFNLAAPAPDWRMLVFVAAGAVVSTVLFGLAPALQATRLDLVPAMHGDVMRNVHPRRARHALIAVQVGASALLLICAAIFLRGAVAAATKDPGVRTSDTLRVSIDTETWRAAVLKTLRAHPLVAVVAASSRGSTRGVVETSLGEGGAETPSRVPVDQMAVSSEYFNVLGLDLVSGRGFTPTERTAEAGVVIVSESIARRLWTNGSGVAQVVRLEAPPSASPGGPSLPSRTLTVIGIVRDPGSGSSSPGTVGGVYLPTGPESPGTYLYLRVRGNPEQARLALLEEGLKGLDPGFGIMTLRAGAGMQTYMLQLAFWLTVVLGGLALVLTVSGLFSVLSYLVEQQAKEIGVRMALGATTRNVAGLVLSQSIRPVGIGLAAGGGLAAAVAIVLMATPAASEIGDLDVLDPVAYAASALVIATACLIAVSVPTLRAARIDPIATLRND